jgi:hypothetical protein
MTEPLVVPDRTSVRGQNPEDSSISFVVTEPMLLAEPWRAAVVVGSEVELAEFSVLLSVVGPPQINHNITSSCKKYRFHNSGTVGVLMPDDAREFRATGLRVTTHGKTRQAPSYCVYENLLSGQDNHGPATVKLNDGRDCAEDRQRQQHDKTRRRRIRSAGLHAVAERLRFERRFRAQRNRADVQRAGRTLFQEHCALGLLCL